MNDDTDFLKLYRELGIEPGCTLQAFKQAYRRRVAGLHPDRMGGGRHDSEGLKELNRQYAASLAFQRLHGRLPGATPTPATRSSTPPPRLERMLETRRSRPPVLPHRPPNRWLLLVISLVAIIPLCSLIPGGDMDVKNVQDLASSPNDDSLTLAPTFLEQGMEAAGVAALLGVPIVDAGNHEHWVYGPSWVRFECGQVVDWYSSPLHPLPLAGPGSAESVQRKHSPRRPRHCLTKPQQESMVYPTDATFARHSGTV